MSRYRLVTPYQSVANEKAPTGSELSHCPEALLFRTGGTHLEAGHTHTRPSITNPEGYSRPGAVAARISLTSASVLNAVPL